MKFKKIISMMVSIIIIGYLITISFVNVGATQSRTDYFNKNYTLGNSQADNVAIIAEAQIGRTKAQMGYTENWCADFVADCGALAGVSKLIPANGVVSSLMNNIKNAGGYEVSSPQRGDIVF